LCKDERERGREGIVGTEEREREMSAKRERERGGRWKERRELRERERQRGKSKSNSGPFCKIRGWRNSATEKEIEFREKDIRGVPLLAKGHTER